MDDMFMKVSFCGEIG